MIFQQPPEGLNRVQRWRWRNHQLAELALDTATRRGELHEQGVSVRREPGRLVRAARALWDKRILLAALALVAAIEAVITITQIPFYRDLPNLRPEVFGIHWPVYVMLPVLTTSLAVYFAAAAGFVISKDAGRYRRYLRLMWLFSAIGAVINVSHALQQLERAGSGEWLSAVFLGSGSLFTPIVWHTYAGLTITTTIKLMSIAERLAVSRQWLRHPRLSWRCAQYLDLFPSLDRAQVWEMVIKQSRRAALIKLGLLTVPQETQETSRWWRKLRAGKRGKSEETSAAAIDEDEVLALLEAQLQETPSAPGQAEETFPKISEETSRETWKLPDETACETTAVRRYKRVWVAAAFHAMESGAAPHTTQAEVARLCATTPGTVSKVFAACREGRIPADTIDHEMTLHVIAALAGNAGFGPGNITGKGEETANVTAR